MQKNPRNQLLQYSISMSPTTLALEMVRDTLPLWAMGRNLAKTRALVLADGYRPPEPVELSLPGPNGKASLDFAVHDLALKGVVTPHDRTVVNELIGVLIGGPEADHTTPTPEASILDLEREAFMRLVRNEATLARMEHMLTTGKPLRN